MPGPLPEWQQQPAAPPAAGAPYHAQPPHQQYPPHYQAPYQQPYPYPYPPARSTNGMAIASMVLGILWVYWVGSILALIFGYVALKDIRTRGQSGEGMAITGIVLGWVGIGALVAVLVYVVSAI